MSPETRNAKVVAILVGSMTLGAAGLLWLEPPARGWASSALLLAEHGDPIQTVHITYAPAGRPFASLKAAQRSTSRKKAWYCRSSSALAPARR